VPGTEGFLERHGTNASRSSPKKDSISDELTIRRLNVNGKPTFVMVTFDTSVGYSDWKDLHLYSACEPQGPFTMKHHFYTTPPQARRSCPA
jgi:hypothetical protein